MRGKTQKSEQKTKALMKNQTKTTNENTSIMKLQKHGWNNK